MYDHPFQWGSRRIGPDLARVGGKYPDLWHFRHMIDPREVTPLSLMPSYPWLATASIDFIGVRKRLSVMRFLGVPYSMNEVDLGEQNARDHAARIAATLKQDGAGEGLENKEIVALIAYLQRLGADYKNYKGVRSGL